MKQITFPILVVTSLLSVPQIASATLTPPASDRAQQVMESALNDNMAWEIVEGLTTEVGARQAGTEAEAKARSWSVAKLKALGLNNAPIEEYQMPTWVRGGETTYVDAPYGQQLHVTALGNSRSTGDARLEAKVAYFPTIEALRSAPGGSLKGKIAFVSHAMKATLDGSSYGAFAPARFVGPNFAAKKAAFAIVIRSAGTDYYRNPHTGKTNFEAGVLPIAAGALSIPDAENLERILTHGKPVKMKLTLTPQDIAMQTSGNVIADIVGSNPKLGIIIMACDLDSRDLATFAIDDAAGCGIINAAALKLKDKDWRPKRSIRLLWAGVEEFGVWGGKEYGAKHVSDNPALAIESDFGAGKVWAVDFNLLQGAKPLRDQIIYALAPLGVVPRQQVAVVDADVGAIIAVQKLGVIDLPQDGTKYFDIHHTPDDTLDKIDKTELQQNVTGWAATLWKLTKYEGDLKPDLKS